MGGMYLVSISSLIHIYSNNTDIVCPHIFVYVLSNRRIISSENWLMNLE